MRDAIKHPILTSARRCCDQSLPEHPSLPHVSLSNQHHERQTKLWKQLKAVLMSYAMLCTPTCCCHVAPTNNTPGVDPTFSLSFEGLHGPINILESFDANGTTCKSFTPSHPPARRDKSSFVSVSTCSALHVPRCFVALCAHLFKGLPFSLHLSLSLSPSLSLALPLSHWWFVFLVWDLGSHSLRAHCSQLLSIPVDGPREAEWVTVGALWPTPTPPPPLLASCHTMMSCFYLLRGAPIDSLSLLHTLYISPVHPTIPPCFPQLVSFPNSCASQKAPGGFWDVWMLFSTPTIHAWHPDRKAISPVNPTATPI